MAKQIPDIRENTRTPLPLLIAAHCSTVRRKAKRLDISELSAILDDLVRELYPIMSSPTTYTNSINQILRVFNANLPPILSEINSHYFFITIRNIIRDLLQQLSAKKKLNDQDTYTLRNCTLFIHHLVKQIQDVSKILHWITDETFLDVLSNCLTRIDKICKKDENQRVIKQIARLLDIFCNIQERLPLDFHQKFFVRLLQPTLQCLTSSNYVKLFKNFNATTNKFTEKEKLFLIKCPYFLTTYNGPHIEQAIEQVLEIMLPRYVSILDQHMRTIKEWNRPIMRAIHNLIITIIYAEGYFSSYTKTESFRQLIDHILNIINEPRLINNINSYSNNIETLLIDATLVVFNVLVYESDALDYIKQSKSTKIFRQLTKTSNQTIVLNAYTMLAYTMDDNDIKTSQDDLTQLLSTTVNLLRRTIENPQQMDINQNIDRNILQLLETLKGLVQHEQIRNEVLKQGILTFLIDCCKKLNGLSKQTLLECIWKLSFNNQIAQQLREYSQFIYSLENIPKPTNDNNLPYAVRRSNSRTSLSKIPQSKALVDATNYEIQKISDGLLWKIVKEPQFREKIIQKTQTNVANDRQQHKYDIMISYCYADKDIVYKIHQFLANDGYTVWFDRDHNNAFAMEIIAEAIENSEIVIICMSDSYKRDNRCQAQAEYALISKRLLLPLIVHEGYKPDGWLASIISNNNYTDIGKYDFKVASELVLKEIKQRQPIKDIKDVNPTASIPAGIVRNPSGTMTVFDKPYTPVESSALNGATTSSLSSFPAVTINRQQQAPTNFTPRSTTPATTFTVSPVIVVKQQQQAQVQSVSTSSIPGTFPSGAPMTVNQQPLSPMNPTPKPSTPDSFIFGASTTVNKQEQPSASMQSTRKPSASDSITFGAPMTVNQHQQPAPPMNPAVKPPTSDAFISGASMTVNQHQQPITSMHPTRKLSASDSITSGAPMTVNQHQQPAPPMNPTVKPPTSDAFISGASMTVNQHQQPITSMHPSRKLSASDSITSGAPMSVNQQPIPPMNPTPKPSTPDSFIFGASTTVNKQEQPTVSMQPTRKLSASDSIISSAPMTLNQHQQPIPPMNPTPKPSTSDSIIFGAPMTANRQEQPTAPTHPIPQPSTPVVPSSTTLITDIPQREVLARSPSGSSTSSSTSSDPTVINLKQKKQKLIKPDLGLLMPANGTSYTSIVTNQQQQQTSVRPVSRSEVPVNGTSSAPIIIDRQPSNESVDSARKSSVSNIIPYDASANIEKKQQQQQPTNFVTQSSSTGAIASVASTDVVQKQQQRTPPRSNSRSTTPAMVPVAPQTNGREQLHLPEKYTSRKTHNSIYRQLSINAWRDNDVLDYLFDLHLHSMMPLCESMSGKALLRLFRMCQKKPSRVYDQLNNELRTRFNGLTLSMGTYTQFLIEMDSLVGPTLDSLPPLPPIVSPAPNFVERVILMPHSNPQSVLTQPSSETSIYSTKSSKKSKSVKPVETLTETTAPGNTRVVERAVYRPASNVGRPYNFIVESLEEPTVLHDQVQRYGNQLLLLDENARHHRELNNLL